MDTNQTQLVSITDFRRNAGAYIRKAVPISIIKDSQVVGTYIPASKVQKSVAENLKKFDSLVGGYNLGNLSPAELNKIFESSYE